MILSIHQPSYFPWLGLLHKISCSDTFLLLDQVQLADRAYQHRNVFLDASGKKSTLTIPINKKSYREKEIRELTISDNAWQTKHERFIEFNYSKHPYFDEIYPQIKFIFEKDYEFLIDVLLDSLLISFSLFDLSTDLVRQSNLEYDRSLFKSDLIVELAAKMNCSEYLSGVGAKNYQSEDEFEKKSIKLRYNEFSHPVYLQKGAVDFIDGLSCLDVLFNEGIEKSRIILNGL